jgi:hypothetical protein
MRQVTTKTKIEFSLTALLLFAAATVMPACDIYNPDPCDPSVESCPFTGNHPSGLDGLN